MNIYSIYDVKADAYLPPFYARTNGEAERMVITTGNDPKSQFNAYPLDFKLVHIGSFDESTGKLSPCDVEDLGTVFYLLKLEEARYHAAEKELVDGSNNS